MKMLQYLIIGVCMVLLSSNVYALFDKPIYILKQNTTINNNTYNYNNVSLVNVCMVNESNIFTQTNYFNRTEVKELTVSDENGYGYIHFGSMQFLGVPWGIFTNDVTYFNSGLGANPYIYNGNTYWLKGGVITQVDGNIGGSSFLARDETGANRVSVYVFQGKAQVMSLSNTDLTFSSNSGTNNTLTLEYATQNAKFIGTVDASAYTTNGSDYAEIVQKVNISEPIYINDVVCIVDGGKATTKNSGCIDYGVISGTTAGYIGGEGDIYEYKNITVVQQEQYCSKNATFLNCIYDYNTYIFNCNNITYCVNTNFRNITTSKRIKYIDNDFTNNAYVPVAFTGQIKVKVTGSCTAGYWLLYNNGNRATCVNPATIPNWNTLLTDIQLRIGVAWETNTSAGNKTILTKIGAR